MAKIVDPDLIADIVRELNVQGALAPFEISEVAVPIFDIGALAAVIVQQVRTPGETTSVRVSTAGASTFLASGPPTMAPATELISSIDLNPTAALVLADTGALAGNRRVITGYASASGLVRVEFVHRNAADNADLGVWTFTVGAGNGIKVGPVAIINALNERFIWRAQSALTGTTTTTIEFPDAAPSTP